MPTIRPNGEIKQPAIAAAALTLALARREAQVQASYPCSGSSTQIGALTAYKGTTQLVPGKHHAFARGGYRRYGSDQFARIVGHSAGAGLNLSDPTSTKLPAYITAMRVATCATTGRLCEIKTYVRANSRCNSCSRSRTCAPTETSRAETGSSATTSFERRISARAIPTRWRWPPENSCGYFRSARSSPRPTRFRISAARSLTLPAI